ncbi:MAG TPA: hypothetical protein VFY99_02095 [Solirubrobacterales bacterium]
MVRVALCLVFIACTAAVPACGGSNDGGRFDGNGYSLEIAGGWEDTTEDAPTFEELGFDDPALAEIGVDATITGEESDDFAPNLAIVTTAAPRTATARKLAEANLRTTREQSTLPSGAGGGTIDTSASEVDDAELGGEPAASYEQVAEAPPGDVRQLQLYAVHDGTAYAVTFSGLDSGQYEEDLPAVEAMLDSWTWI